jgi:hypothetical protein
MKKYILLLVPVVVYIIVDLLTAVKKPKYTDEERLSNLEKAREAKKAKSILGDFEQSNNIENAN